MYLFIVQKKGSLDCGYSYSVQVTCSDSGHMSVYINELRVSMFYHCTTALFFQNSPFGEPGGKRARWTGVTAPSSGEREAFGPAMSVLTQPGQQQLINTSSLPSIESKFIDWV